MQLELYQVLLSVLLSAHCLTRQLLQVIRHRNDYGAIILCDDRFLVSLPYAAALLGVTCACAPL